MPNGSSTRPGDHRTVPDEERERRLQALQHHTTVMAAARDLGLPYTTLHQWSQWNYPRHDEEFGSDTSRGKYRDLVERVDATLASLEDDIRSLSKDRLGRRDRRRVEGALSDIEWLRVHIHDKTGLNPRGGDVEVRT